MGSRLELQIKLEEIINNKNVYYQPPENLKMVYPAIRYTKTNIDSRYANDKRYLKTNRYEIIVIDRLPDNKAIDKLLELPMSSYQRHYTSDNLHHDIIEIYF